MFLVPGKSKKNEAMIEALAVPNNSRFLQSFQRFAENKAALVGVVLLLIITLACIFLPYFLPNKFDEVDYYFNNHAPTWEGFHIFGTDDAGRDLFVRTLIGGRISLLVGFCAALLSVVFGMVYGATSGYIGGYVDTIMMRIVDVMYSIPYLVTAILVITIFGQDIYLVILTIVFFSWMDVARVVRGQTLAIKSQEYIDAAMVIGASNWRIILKHIIPNLVGIVTVYATVTIPSAIVSESVLSFLGLGVQEPYTSWGLLISEGAGVMEYTPWLLLMPGILLSCTLFSANYIGDGLRDAFDPRQDIKQSI